IKLKSEIGENWNNFFDEYLDMSLDDEGKVNRKEFEDLVIEEFPLFTPHALTKKLKVYCQYNGLDFSIENSGGIQTFKIVASENVQLPIENTKCIEEKESDNMKTLLSQLNNNGRKENSNE